MPAPPHHYLQLVRRLAELIPVWCAEHPAANLAWHEWRGRMYAGNLCAPFLGYLAASPDAVRLLEWLDDNTAKEATLLQAVLALELLGQLPPAFVREQEFRSLRPS